MHISPDFSNLNPTVPIRAFLNLSRFNLVRKPLKCLVKIGLLRKIMMKLSEWVVLIRFDLDMI